MQNIRRPQTPLFLVKEILECPIFSIRKKRDRLIMSGNSEP